MNRADDLGFFVFLGTAAVLFLIVLVLAPKSYKQQALENGCLQYNQKTGELEWAHGPMKEREDDER